ncbi:MAG: response regulator [Gemmatimonadota bacterium]
MMRILIVDDEAAVRLLCVRALQTHYDVIPVESADQAISRFEATRPNLIVCDIGLPGMSGLDLIGRLRATSPDLPVLIITGKAHGNLLNPDEEKTAFLAKPFTPEELRKAVTALLEANPEADPTLR